MNKTLSRKLRRYEGQPIKIFSDDGRVRTGFDFDANEDTVQILDKCQRPFLYTLCHIDAVELPQMRLHRCHRDCDKD